MSKQYLFHQIHKLQEISLKYTVQKCGSTWFHAKNFLAHGFLMEAARRLAALFFYK